MNSENQFIALITEHQSLINKVLFMYGDDEEERKDLYQEIVSSAWSAFKRFRGDSKFSTWLYRVAINVAITSLKKKKKVSIVSDMPERHTPPETSSERELLHIILEQLNPVEKSIVMLMVESVKQEEIADILGISPGNIRVKIHRIREKLRKYGIEEFVG